jgi:hypothetical protein
MQQVDAVGGGNIRAPARSRIVVQSLRTYPTGGESATMVDHKQLSPAACTTPTSTREGVPFPVGRALDKIVAGGAQSDRTFMWGSETDMGAVELHNLALRGIAVSPWCLDASPEADTSCDSTSGTSPQTFGMDVPESLQRGLETMVQMGFSGGASLQVRPLAVALVVY